MIRLEFRGQVAFIHVESPANRNALNRAAMKEFAAAIDEVIARKLNAAFIRGAGEKVFISGADLKDLDRMRTREDVADMARTMRSTLDRMAPSDVLFVALINGHAVGGGAEIAVACDFRVASEDSRIRFIHSHLGLIPAWGGAERLAGIVGRSAALYLLSSAATITCTTALRLGLVEEAVPRQEFDRRAEELADQLGALPPHVVASMKRRVQSAPTPAGAPAAIEDFVEAWMARPAMQNRDGSEAGG